MYVYSPSEDSFLLSHSLEDYLESLNEKERQKIIFLDMGTGSGIQSETASQFLNKDNILAIDTNPESVKFAKNLGFNAIKSDLFSNIKGGLSEGNRRVPSQFDIIAFNPPYLPADEFDKEIDTTGGEKGDEIALAFLIASKNYLTDKGVIFLLVSSLTPKEKLEEEIKKQKKHKEVVASKKLFFETLEVWKITN